MNIPKGIIAIVIVAILAMYQDIMILRNRVDIYKLTCVQVDLSRSSELTNAIVLQFKKP